MKTINLIGWVGWEISNRWLLRELPEDKSEPVTLFIDSDGGDAFEGFSIFNTIDKRSNVFIEIGARAFSAASYWPFATDAAKVTVNKNSSWMGHNAASFAYGDRHEMKKRLVMLEGIDNIIADTYTDRLGLNKKQVMSKMDDEFWLFGGQSIIDAGLAGKIREGSDTNHEMPERSEVVENFRAVFNEKMSHKPDQPTDWKLLNLVIDDFKTRKDINVGKLKEETPTPAPVNTPAAAPVVPVAPVATPAPVAPVAPVVDNTVAINEAVTAERTRIMNLVKLSGANLTAPAMEAINSSKTAGEYAIAQLEANAAAPAPANAASISIGAAPTPADNAASVNTVDGVTAKNEAAIKQGNAVYEASKKK